MEKPERGLASLRPLFASSNSNILSAHFRYLRTPIYRRGFENELTDRRWRMTFRSVLSGTLSNLKLKRLSQYFRHESIVSILSLQGMQFLYI